MKNVASLKDVAKLAGVGLGTCSRVLNQHPSVSEEKKQAVLKAMAELGYQPNAIARSLKSKTTKTIGVMIPDISNYFYPEIVRGMEDTANIYNYNIILCSTDLDRDKEILCLSMLCEKKVDGILFISSSINERLKHKLEEIETPIVLISTQDDENRFPSVTIDNEAASFEAVDYLCKLGHKNICMLAGDINDPNAGWPRINGYRRALKSNGIEVLEDNIYPGDHRYHIGYANMKKLLDEGKRPTAVFAASDTIAIGAAKAILEIGLRIPGDISIIGFDGLESSEFFYPSITTIEQPRYQMGAAALRLLTKVINKEEIEDKNMFLSYKLLERKSCKRL